MRKVLSVKDALREIPYPDPTSTAVTDPIQATFKLPEYVFTTDKDDMKMGVWDTSTNTWNSELIEELNFDKAKRELSFKTRKFAPIAFLQPKTIDFPYDSWYLRCTDEQVGLLTINTKRITLNIEIHPLGVKLVENKYDELNHIADKEMHPGMLLFELSKCGIHMLPEDDDAARGGIHLKNKDAEERAIMDIAQNLKVFAFQSMKWSQQASEDNLVVRLRENPDNDRVFLEDDESDWKSIMWWSNKVAYIKARNCDPTFNTDFDDGAETHSLLAFAVKGVYSEDTYEKCQYLHDIDFIDNVQRVLRMTRLLSFSTDAFDKRSLEEQQK